MNVASCGPQKWDAPFFLGRVPNVREVTVTV